MGCGRVHCFFEIVLALDIHMELENGRAGRQLCLGFSGLDVRKSLPEFRRLSDLIAIWTGVHVVGEDACAQGHLPLRQAGRSLGVQLLLDLMKFFCHLPRAGVVLLELLLQLLGLHLVVEDLSLNVERAGDHALAVEEASRQTATESLMSSVDAALICWVLVDLSLIHI